MTKTAFIRRLGAALAAIAAMAGVAAAQAPPPAPPPTTAAPALPSQNQQSIGTPQPPAVPPAEILLLLVRNAFAALNQANQTGNYTVLHALGSPTLQAQNSPAQLGIVFTGLRDQGVDLSPSLVLTPQLTETPSVTADGQLRLAGYFPTQPLQLDFVIIYRRVEARWRIEGMAVSAKPVAAASAKPAADPSAPPAAKAKSEKIAPNAAPPKSN